MRAPRTLLLVLVTALLGALAVAFAPSSSAGGPTSVLLVDPASGRATALYASDPRYDRLSELLRAMSAPASDGSAPVVAGGGWGPGSGGITVTWLMHDVAVWRIDHVFLGAHTIAIGSTSDLAGLTGFDQKPVWHRADDPAALTSLLNALGVGPQAVAPAATARPVVERSQPAAATPAAPAVPAPLWGLAGLLLGAGMVLVAGRLPLRVRPAPADDEDGAEVPSSAEVLHG